MRYRKNRTAGDEMPPFVDPEFAEALSGNRGDREIHRKQHHKDQMLCRQVQRALNLALAGECRDDVLRELYVADVVTAPNVTHLLVQVTIPPSVSLIDVLERLAQATPRLRAQVAHAITRKRTPELTFVPAASEQRREGQYE
jgi:ribosome-binding factor A